MKPEKEKDALITEEKFYSDIQINNSELFLFSNMLLSHKTE